MSVVTMFSNTSEAYQQQTVGKFNRLREYNAPGWNAFRNNLEKRKAGEKGIKINYSNITHGGHSTPTALRPDWNEPVAGEELASYVFPVRYRLPMIFDHGTLRDFRQRSQIAANNLRDKVMEYEVAALKRLNRAFYGTGDGALAYSTSAITALGSATMNCDTTPAVAPGHTKGAKWLDKSNLYQAINTSTGLPRGLFVVTATGTTSCTITLLSGTISSGDPIVNVNTYNGFFRGLGFLISEANRTIQGINTADVPDLNSYGIDLAGAPLTFAAFEDLWTGLAIRNNDGKKTGKVVFLPPGQGSVLRKSAQNLRTYQAGDNVARGIMEDVDFGSNTNAVIDADMDEDRVYAAVYDEFGMLEEMPLDVMDMDGQEWHQLMGANNSGSERYQRGIGWDGNFFRKANAMGSAYIYRASTTGVLTQSSI